MAHHRPLHTIFAFAAAVLAALPSSPCRAQSAADLVNDGTLAIPHTLKDETQLPSPGAEQMLRYVDCPVSYNTGVVSVNVPIYDIAVGNFHLPLYLSYHGGGIKVEDYNCHVGLGWSLRGGGCVSRTVRGRPDEDSTCVFRLRDADGISRDNDLAYLISVLHRRTDAYRDRYDYTFGDYSGSFMIIDGRIVQMPQTDITIEQTGATSEGVRDFVATTPDGCRYYFTEREHIEYSYYPRTLELQESASPNYRAVSAWHLGRIVTPSDGDTITFAYDTVPFTRSRRDDRLRSRSFTLRGKVVVADMSLHMEHLAQSVTAYPDRRLLSSIRSRTCMVRLSSAVSAAPRHATLNAIDVMSPDGSVVRSASLEYTGTADGRVLLSSVSLSSGGHTADRRTMSYYSGTAQLHSDLFGYNNYDTADLSNNNYDSVLNDDGSAGESRAHRFASAVGLALRSVTDATGSETVLRYEPSECGGFLRTVGIGLRVRSIETSDHHTGRWQRRTFGYSNAACTINFNSLTASSFIAPGGQLDGGGLDIPEIVSSGATLTASCRVPGAIAENAAVYYGKVTETVEGTGIDTPLLTEYEFDLGNVPNTYVSASGIRLPDLGVNGDNERYLGTCIPYVGNNERTVFGPQYVTGHFRETFIERAPLVRKTTYRHTGSGYTPLDEELHSYSAEMERPVVTGLHVESAGRKVTRNGEAVDRFRELRDFIFLNTTAVSGRLFRDSTVRVRHFPDGSVRRTSLAYGYNGRRRLTAATHGMAARVTVIPLDSIKTLDTGIAGFADNRDVGASTLHNLQSVRARCGSRTLDRYYCYSSNMQTAHYRAVCALGQLNLPVMEKVVADGSDTILTVSTYTSFGPASNIRLSSRRILHRGSEVASLSFGGYDRRGNVLSSSANHTAPVSYTWGFNESLPVSVSHQSAVGTVLETRYGHIPLVGCTSIEHPSGRRESFSYTGGRLSSTRDSGGNLTSSLTFDLSCDTGTPSHTGVTSYTAAGGACGLTTDTYYDGLGLPLASVSRRSAPDGSDVATLVERDALGRVTSEWLPVPVPSGGGAPNATAFGRSASAFYGDSQPFAHNEYELSPDPSPRLVTTAGSDLAGHPSSHATLCSSESSPSLVCRRFAVSGDYALRDDGQYAPGELSVDKTVDGDGRAVFVFTDWRGNKILERRPAGGGATADTYYVYDCLGNLRFVLPPALCGMETVSGNSWDIRTCCELRDYAYFYRYDARLSLVERKLPGAEPVLYINDLSGSPVLSQDGSLRESGKWRFSISDSFGRAAIDGLCSAPDTADIAGKWVRAVYSGTSATSSTVCSTGYTVNACLPSAELLTARYYDDYTFLGLPQFSGVGVSGAPGNALGLQTGSLMAVLSGDAGTDGRSPSAICRVMQYDSEDRLVRSETSNLLGGKDTETLTLSFTGKPLVRTVVHTTAGSRPLTETTTTDYDTWDRPLRAVHRLNDSTRVTLSDISYDALGRVASDRRGASRLATVYAYDMRGWTTSVSSPLFSESLYYAQPHNGSTPQYCGNISAADWRVDSPTEHGKLRGYTYSYDALSRLSAASYSDNGTPNGNYSTRYSYDLMGNVTSLLRNGLLDDGSFGAVDDLACSYDGNRVVRISDSAAAPCRKDAMHFVDGADKDVEYGYDANGNMTMDLNRGIKSLSYNVLNLPCRMRNGDTSGMPFLAIDKTITYSYASDGTKLRVEYSDPLRPSSQAVSLPVGPIGVDSIVPVLRGSDITMDYCGNAVYRNGRLETLTVDGGYISFDRNGIATYHFYLKDHLGSNRVVASPDGDIEEINHYYPFGALMGESVNTTTNRYKYVGKELDRMFGVDWQDHGARWYDVLGIRWNGMDFLSENNIFVSPYSYSKNSPISRCDKNGLDDYYSIDGDFLFSDDKPTDNIIIRDTFTEKIRAITGAKWVPIDTPINKMKMPLSSVAYSKIFTRILSNMPEVNIHELYNDQVSVNIIKEISPECGNTYLVSIERYNEADNTGGAIASIMSYKGKKLLTVYLNSSRLTESLDYYSTVSNVQNGLGVHEYIGHFVMNYRESQHDKIYKLQIQHKSWKKATEIWKNLVLYQQKTFR